MAELLLVDDSPTEVLLLQRMLQRHGHAVHTAGDAETALAVVRRQRLDLILMDVVLPGKSGFQATRELTADRATCTIPVIMLSSKNQQIDRIWGLRQGARVYLTKPIGERDLIAQIEQVLEPPVA